MWKNIKNSILKTITQHQWINIYHNLVFTLESSLKKFKENEIRKGIRLLFATTSTGHVLFQSTLNLEKKFSTTEKKCPFHQMKRFRPKICTLHLRNFQGGHIYEKVKKPYQLQTVIFWRMIFEPSNVTRYCPSCTLVRRFNFRRRRWKKL